MRMAMVFGLVLAAVVMTGCGSLGKFPSVVSTQVELSESNYEVVQTNLHGSSSGFGLFFSFAGIPLARALDTEAVDEMVDAAGMQGRSVALVNVAKESKVTNWILFHTVTVEYRADAIEFK